MTSNEEHAQQAGKWRQLADEIVTRFEHEAELWGEDTAAAATVQAFPEHARYAAVVVGQSLEHRGIRPPGYADPRGSASWAEYLADAAAAADPCEWVDEKDVVAWSPPDSYRPDIPERELDPDSWIARHLTGRPAGKPQRCAPGQMVLDGALSGYTGRREPEGTEVEVPERKPAAEAEAEPEPASEPTTEPRVGDARADVLADLPADFGKASVSGGWELANQVGGEP